MYICVCKGREFPRNKKRLVRTMKFTKKEMRKAIKENNQTKVWKLCALKLGRTPTKSEVCKLVDEIADTELGRKKAFDLAFNSFRKRVFSIAMDWAFIRRGGYAQFGDSHYRLKAISMLKRLNDEPLSSYTKIPIFGANTLYFCSPSYGMKDYNKVRCCDIERNRKFCEKVLEIGNAIYNRKKYGR